MYMLCSSHVLQLSLQLFDSRHELHKTTCNYALELNSLHSKTTPDFLNRIVSRGWGGGVDGGSEWEMERGRDSGRERARHAELYDTLPLDFLKRTA